jgi:hypothetical protein
VTSERSHQQQSLRFHIDATLEVSKGLRVLGKGPSRTVTLVKGLSNDDLVALKSFSESGTAEGTRHLFSSERSKPESAFRIAASSGLLATALRR